MRLLRSFDMTWVLRTVETCIVASTIVSYSKLYDVEYLLGRCIMYFFLFYSVCSLVAVVS